MLPEAPFYQNCILKTYQQFPQKQIFSLYFSFEEKKQVGKSLQSKENEFA